VGHTPCTTMQPVNDSSTHNVKCQVAYHYSGL